MENNNSVCFVSRINEIKIIEGADNIEQAVIGGWNCIIKKNEYNVNDLVVIATTDAVIPQGLSDAMNVTNYLRKGGRVRIIKLRGVYSECLIIPITYVQGVKRVEGADVMEMLGIFKYEPPAKQIQLASGRKIKYHENPNFNVYHKFPNIKNVKNMFNEGDEVQITRKIHGTNTRYGIVRKNKLSIWDKVRIYLNIKFNLGGDEWKWSEYEFIVGSHNVEKGSDSQGFYNTNVWYEIANKYEIKKKLWELIKKGTFSKEDIGNGIIIYGEIYGVGIQQNYDYGLKTIEFALFDIMINNQYISTDAVLTLHKLLELNHVPLLYIGPWSQHKLDLLSMNNFIDNTKIPHEGIVVKSIDGNRQKIAKVINPDYLIYAEKKDVGDSH